MSKKSISVKEFLRINGPSNDKTLFCAIKMYGTTIKKSSDEWTKTLIVDKVIDATVKSDIKGGESEE